MLPYHNLPEIYDFNLSSEDIHLWVIELPLAHLKPNKKELEFIRLERQLILKKILKKYIGHSDFKFLQNPNGKPFLDSYSLSFNLSHSHHLMLIALHPDKPLGIDLEFIKKRDVQQFSQRFWGKDFYYSELESKPNYLKNMAFYQAWTQTEAWVKYHGETVFNHQEFTPQMLLSKKPFKLKNKLFLNFMPQINFCATLCCDLNVSKIFLKKIKFDLLK